MQRADLDISQAVLALGLVCPGAPGYVIGEVGHANPANLNANSVGTVRCTYARCSGHQ